YRIDIAMPAGQRMAELERLAVGTEHAEITATGLRLRLPALGPEVLAALERIARESPSARIEIAQPAMTDVFRRVLGTTPAPAGGRGRNPRRLRTRVRRGVQATLRDPFTVTILVTVPIAALMLFGFVLATDVDHLTLGLYDGARSAASRRLVADLAASGTFDV